MASSPGKNLFNKYAVKAGCYLGESGMIIQYTDDTFFVSNFIPMNGKNIIVNQACDKTTYGAIYDKNFKVMSTQNMSNTLFIYEKGAKYIRFTHKNSIIDKIMAEYGNVSSSYLPYVPFKEMDDYVTSEKSLEIAKTNCPIKKNGKNLLDPKNYVLGEWVTSTGEFGSVGYGLGRSGYIPIKEGQTLTASSLSGFFQCFAALYDKNLVFIPGSLTDNNSVAVRKISWMENAAYAVFTFRTLEKAMVEVGTEATEYEPYTDDADIQEQLDEIPKLIEKTENMITLEPEYNLFDKSKATDSAFFTTSGSIATYNKDFYITDFIPVKPNTSYVGKSLLFASPNISSCVFYDEEKHIIECHTEKGPIISPSNAAYLRSCGYIKDKDIAMIIKGTEEPNVYSPYKLSVPSDVLPSGSTFSNTEMVLPKKMFFLKGKEIAVYYDNIILKERKRDIQVIMKADVLGTSRELMFAGIPSEAGAGTITIKQTLENFKEISNDIAFEVIDPDTKKGRSLNILCIGDSFTDIGTWVNEIYNQLTDNGITVDLIGTQIKGNNNHEALSGGTLKGFVMSNAGPGIIVEVSGIAEKPSTSYGGTQYRDSNGTEWAVRGYKLDDDGDGKLFLGIFKNQVSDTYTESENFPVTGSLTKTHSVGDDTVSYSNAQVVYFNPFWNVTSKELDFSYYINLWEFANPDLLILQFTWNDLNNYATDNAITTFITNIKTVIDTFHSEYPDAKAIFSIEPQGSLLPSGFDADGRNYSTLNFAKRMFETFEDDENYNTWFRVSPSYCGVDRINGYGGSDVALCSRYPNILTKVAGDTTHCNDAGMRQISDVIIPIIYSLI